MEWSLVNELFLSGWKEGHKTESAKQIHLSE